MNTLNELVQLGLHDAKINEIRVGLEKKNVEMRISVLCEKSQLVKGSELTYRNGKLSFENVQSCKIDGAYDFLNSIVILQGEVDGYGCNFYLSSDQSVIIKADAVFFAWKS